MLQGHEVGTSLCIPHAISEITRHPFWNLVALEVTEDIKFVREHVYWDLRTSRSRAERPR